VSDTPSTSAAVRMRERATMRTARYALLGAEPVASRRVWIVLHGYGMLAARFLRAFADVIPADTCVIAPEALSRFYLESPRADGGHLQRVGATWLTRESRETEIADAHRWLDAVHDEILAEVAAAGGAPPLVGVLGFSQGVATAMRWIANGHVAPRQFVAWAGGLAQDVDGAAFTSKMRHGETVLVAGTDDHFATPVARAAIADAIQSLGVPHRAIEFAGGHHLDHAVLRTVLAEFGTGPA
jgi:predicted esterase